MTTLRIHVQRRVRYLWLKAVHGFDPRVHCARCLKGEYHAGMNPNGVWKGQTIEVEFDPTAAPFHYLCGVTSAWEDNLHLAMVCEPDAPAFTVRQRGILVEVSGGVRALTIPEPIEGARTEYGTCRNWLFGIGYLCDEPSRAIAAVSAVTASCPLP